MPFVYNINARNVNEALPSGLRVLSGFNGITEPSRNGPVRSLLGPVCTQYAKPQERVLFSAVRDANPFFHLFEALWMLAGRNDLQWLAQFNKRIASYSDDGGITQPAAYGHRWRNYFGYDQLENIIVELRARPDSRRAVLAMWDPGHDTEHVGDLARAIDGSADIPCNTQCFFRVRGGELDMCVTCRSNDILWGAYGANAVHFSVLQEYVAARLGLGMGSLYQFSFNYHYYVDVVGDNAAVGALVKDCEDTNRYATNRLGTMPMFADPVKFMAELPTWMDWVAHEKMYDGGFTDSLPNVTEPFLREVATPMSVVWALHKQKNYPAAEAVCANISADDWRYACRAWIERRAFTHRSKEQNDA